MKGLFSFLPYFYLAILDSPTPILAPLASDKSITAIKWGEYLAMSIPMQSHSRQGSLIHSGATLLFITLINGPGDWRTFLPATEVLIRMGTFKLSVSATPFTLPTSFCLFFSPLSLLYRLLAMSVWVSALNRIDSLCALKDDYIRGPAGLTPSSETLTCLSPLKRPSHPLHRLIGHCHREKKLKSHLNSIQCLRAM